MFSMLEKRKKLIAGERDCLDVGSIFSADDPLQEDLTAKQKARPDVAYMVSKNNN